MRNLEKRIAALEVQTASVEPLTIIRRFVSPGQPLTELQGLKDNEDNNEWQRQPGETEQSLIHRASLLCTRNAAGVASLVGYC
jgi:hypothetical protein